MAEVPFSDQHISIKGSSGAEIKVRFRDVVELINEGIYCVNSEGTLVFANERFCKAMGYQVSEIIGRSFLDLVLGEENVRISKAKLELRKRGISDSYDILMKKKKRRRSLAALEWQTGNRPQRGVYGSYCAYYRNCPAEKA